MNGSEAVKTEKVTESDEDDSLPNGHAIDESRMEDGGIVGMHHGLEFFLA